MKTCPVCSEGYPSDYNACPTDGARLVGSKELEPGTVIRGKYRIVRQLGRGGMGTVYQAEHLLLGRQRALKFISGDLSQDPQFLKRFRQEAQAASELRHANVAEVYDLDQAEDGSPYIAMEYVEGPDLARALARGMFPVGRALAIARGVALGLGAAHGKGIVHRDVKPENILLAGAGGSAETSKLLDFGIAAIRESVTTVGQTQGMMLTPHYAAPEQWRGMAAAEVDGRADLYALGGVLYQMLTGKTCFHAEYTEGWMFQHLQATPQAPSRLRPEVANWPGLDALVLQLLAKDRERRPRDAAETVRLMDAVVRAAHQATPETVKAVPAAAAKVVEAPRDANEFGEKSGKGRGKDSVKLSPWGWFGLAVGLGVAAIASILLFHGRPSSAPAVQQSSAQPGAVQPGAGQSGAGQASVPRPAFSPAFGPAQTQTSPAVAGKTPDSPQGEGPKRADGQQDPGGNVELMEEVSDAMISGAGRPAGKPVSAPSEQQAESLFNEKRYAEAKPLLEQGCSAKNADACFYLGKMAGESLGMAANYTEAVEDYSKSCDGGNLKACNNLGVLFNRGQGVAQDYGKAWTLFTQVCTAGNAKACSNLAEMYVQGHGMAAPNYDRAEMLYQKACDGGESNACGQLGLMLTEGNTLTKDFPRAANLYQKACNMGNAMGCNDLGILTINGKGVAADAVHAVALFTQACGAGVMLGCDNEGLAYEGGQGVARDAGMARALYMKACNGGQASGCGHLAKMR